MVFSRVASFAARTAQGLIGTPDRKVGRRARGRLHKFVDDPVIAAAGKPDAVEELVDFIILWWLVLGIPLSWKKGGATRADATHPWIGVLFSMGKQGTAKMWLPADFVETLIEQVVPCAGGACRPNLLRGTGGDSITLSC